MNTTTEDAIMEIVTRFEPLINKLATTFVKPPRVTRDDLCQEGRLAAYNAVVTYDESFGASLKTWIHKCVRNAMIGFFQNNVYELHSTPYFQKGDLDTIKAQEKRLVSLDKDFGDDLKLGDTIPGSDSPLYSLIQEEQNKLLAREINALEPREKFILLNSKLFLGELTLEEIGDELKVSKQCVSQSLKKIITKLKNNLQEVA